MDERSAFVARQLLRTLRDTASDEGAAFAHMDRALSDRMRAASRDLQRTLSSSALGGDAESDWLHVALRCMRLLRERGVSMTGAVWDTLQSSAAENSEISAALAQSLMRTLALTVATSLIALVVAVIYVIFVLPQFEALFSGMGAALPAFTNAVLSGGRSLLFVAPLLGLVILTFFLPIKFEWAQGGRRWRFAPLVRRVRIGRNLATHYRQQLFIAYAWTLTRCGVAPRDALAAASSETELYADIDFKAMHAGQTMDALATALFDADRLGHLAEEIESQRAVRTQLLARAAERFQLDVSLAMRTILYILVGALLVAMYLPIFKLGAVA